MDEQGQHAAAGLQRNLTAASARLRVNQFHDFEDRSADLHGGRQGTQSGYIKRTKADGQ